MNIKTEWCRFLHMNLDVPVKEVNIDKSLSFPFVQRWSRRMKFLIKVGCELLIFYCLVIV